MKGKDKCQILKEIRAQIAAANEIEWVTENCTHKGDCRGTCPKCESEVAALEKALARRRALGKTVAVAGLSAGMIVSTALTTSCALGPGFGSSTNGDMEPKIAGGMTVATTTVATTTEQPDEPEFPGVPVIGQYSDEYEACDPIEYTVFAAQMYANSFHDLIGIDDPLSIEMANGASFTVIGYCPDRLMIEYDGGRYWIYEYELSESAEPRQTESNE